MGVRVTEQRLLSNGVLTFYSDASCKLMPYLVDENGDEYVDLFPNSHEEDCEVE